MKARQLVMLTWFCKNIIQNTDTEFHLCGTNQFDNLVALSSCNEGAMWLSFLFYNTDGLVQDCSNSNSMAMELMHVCRGHIYIYICIYIYVYVYIYIYICVRMCPYTRVCYPHTCVYTYMNFAGVYVTCFHMLVQFACVRVCVCFHLRWNVCYFIVGK